MFTVDDGKLIILVQECKCLCNLQYEKCDKNFVTGKCLKETGADLEDNKFLPSLIK
jgi:hypothetical protein